MTARFAPVWRYAVRRSREAARLSARVRQLELDNAALRAHLHLARGQTERAVIVALGGEWTAADASWAATAGIDVEL